MDDSFRDHVTHIDDAGHRVFFYPKKPNGKYYQWRSYLSYVYLVVFFALPFVRIDGQPIFLFDILERKYVLFSVRFWPQDFFIFVLGMLSFIVFIALFTVIYGRIFCGWVCPQTVFMEMVFRKIEYWIDGDAAEQKALKKMNWNAEKIRKRSIKYILFLLFSFLVGNTFLSYIIGTDQLWALINEPIQQHIGSLSLMIIFTLVFFFVYVWFREQVCLVVCPYGRMQGVLLDKKSIVVTYDHVRGEPRHKAHKGIISGEGDCIDCKACVHVCPTGIDIRNGTQLECVNCTACIDACNHIMDSINLPQGLIRYDSEEGVQTKQKWKITPRMIGYSVILLLIVALEITLLATRSSIGMSIIRARGTLFTTEADGSISNLYNIKLINKTEHDMPVELKLKERVGLVKWIGKQEIIIPASSSLDAEFFLTVPANAIPEQKNKWKMECWSSGKKIGSDNINFIAPHR